MVANRENDGLTEEEIHHVLSNERRRLVLESLREERNPITSRDLAEKIAEFESGETPAPRNIRQSAYVSLHQTHLPKLDDLGIVEYDTQAKEVEISNGINDVEKYLRGHSSDKRWNIFYVMLGLGGLVTVLGSIFSLPGISIIPSFYWASLFLLGIVILSIYQLGWLNESL